MYKILYSGSCNVRQLPSNTTLPYKTIFSCPYDSGIKVIVASEQTYGFMYIALKVLYVQNLSKICDHGHILSLLIRNVALSILCIVANYIGNWDMPHLRPSLHFGLLGQII